MSPEEFDELSRSLQAVDIELSIENAPRPIGGLCVSLRSVRDDGPAYCLLPVDDFGALVRKLSGIRPLAMALAAVAAGGGGVPSALISGVCARCGGWYWCSSYASDQEAGEVTLCAVCATRCATVGLGTAISDLEELQGACAFDDRPPFDPEAVAAELEVVNENLAQLQRFVADPLKGGAMATDGQ